MGHVGHGQFTDGSYGSWVINCDPLSALAGRINEVILYCTSGPVSTGMDERLRTAKRPQYATSHPGQLSLLPYAGWEISAGQSAVVLILEGMVVLPLPPPSEILNTSLPTAL